MTEERIQELMAQAKAYEACGAMLDAEDLWAIIRLTQRTTKEGNR
jgi:hypothetical protein